MNFMMRKTWSNVKILLKHHTTQCGVVLPHRTAMASRRAYVASTPPPRHRRDYEFHASPHTQSGASRQGEFRPWTPPQGRM